VSTSASTHSLHTRFCVYQRVSIASTLDFVCISEYP
jgi:hypothetical protein